MVYAAGTAAVPGPNQNYAVAAGGYMEEMRIPVTCPICGRKAEFPLSDLKEGSIYQCPHCSLKLTLHGHMLAEIQESIERMLQEEAGKK
jgi:DNA-directed RNA polymerase subunit RPC12/RpoP